MHDSLGPDAVERRLEQIENEWDVERALFAVSGIALLGAAALGLKTRRAAAIPAAIGALFLQHGLSGTCAPARLLRHAGLRTKSEIAHEKYSLKAMRGDFDQWEFPGENEPQSAAEPQAAGLGNA